MMVIAVFEREKEEERDNNLLENELTSEESSFTQSSLKDDRDI